MRNDELAGQILDYESGNLSQDEIIALFQALVNNGMAWSLQGHYGRVATNLIDLGYIRSDGSPDEAP